MGDYNKEVEDMNEVAENKHGQGVVSQICFPLGQDEIAVGKAIRSLLKDGWEFHELTLKEIKLQRMWEA